MKKLIFAVFAMTLFMAALNACTKTTASDDQLYEQQATDKDKVKRPGHGD